MFLRLCKDSGYYHKMGESRGHRSLWTLIVLFLGLIFVLLCYRPTRFLLVRVNLTESQPNGYHGYSKVRVMLHTFEEIRLNSNSGRTGNKSEKHVFIHSEVDTLDGKEQMIFDSHQIVINDLGQNSERGSDLELVTSSDPQCDPETTESLRFDCHPEDGVTKDKCVARGCCWKPVLKGNRKLSSPNVRENPEGVPWCYYPTNYPGYTVQNTSTTPYGLNAEITRSSRSYYPDDVMDVSVQVLYETDSRLRIRISDPQNSRYEVPLNIPSGGGSQNPLYSVKMSDYGQTFGFTVTRATGNETVLLDTYEAAPFMFANQYLQFSSFLPSRYVYGLGEHRGPLLHSVNWTRFTMWNKDQPPKEDSNLYGAHPFYLVMEEDGRSHGVFLLNSNAMDVVLQPSPAITWRTIGGILDLYIFLGPSPSEVIQQYTEVIGHSFMPPYWSLGFHLCRWGYMTANKTLATVDKLREFGIPQDVQWNDIDYMDEHLDFTTGSKFGDQAGMVQELHARGLKYIMILDPGISSTQKAGTYPPYDVGIQMDIFIKDAEGNPLVGRVWPGLTVFPDFTNPQSTDYWTRMLKTFHDQVEFDGLWIDMNELSNFVDGSTKSCPNNSIENPPFVPAVLGGTLRSRTVCATSKQNISISYNVHNLYGTTEAQASYTGLKTIRNKRPFVISRSTFAGHGSVAGHWSGDNFATYKDMYYSIPEILNFNMFGVSVIGADICGFQLNTNEELCTRWHQLGAFYPFSRNHNGLEFKDQDPTAFGPAMAERVANVYKTRYSLLPYLYTLFHKSHMMGETVARPLFFEYPKDKSTYSVDKQFLWGSSLLISPVLTQGATKVDAYFPRGTWYDFYLGTPLTSQGSDHTLDASLDKINLHVREGSIIVMQEPSLTTTDSRKNKFQLLVALDGGGAAEGDLFWDDGDTIDTHSAGTFNMVQFHSSKNIVSNTVMHAGYKAEAMVADKVTVYGVLETPQSVKVNGKSAVFSYDPNNKVLVISNQSIDLLQQFSVEWLP